MYSSSTETIVGVNKYRPEKVEKVDVLSIDNSVVREKQIARINLIRQTRDKDVVFISTVFCFVNCITRL